MPSSAVVALPAPQLHLALAAFAASLKLPKGPMVTANVFEAGHRVRIEVSSSNFPRYDRNLNTGGDNWSETEGVVARNAVHHSAEHPSRIVLTVLEP